MTNKDTEKLVQIILENEMQNERKRKHEEVKIQKEKWTMERERIKHWIKMVKISNTNLQESRIITRRTELIEQTGIRAIVEKWEITKMSTILENTPTQEFILTEPFYVIPDGHRLCLKIYPNGTAETGSRWLTASILVLHGRYDEDVQWPMDYEITITVESQKHGVQHRSKNLLNVDPGRNRPSGEQYQEMYPTRIIRTRDLKGKKKFLNKDTMTIRLTMNKKTPIKDGDDNRSLEEIRYRWLTERRTSVRPEAAQFTLCRKIWELKDITRKNWELFGQSKWTIQSKPFLTWEKGYCFRMRIHPYGTGTETGTHLSIGLAIEQGPYDDLLEWPFLGVWECTLFNHEENKPDEYKI